SLVEPQDFLDHFVVGLNIIHLVAGFAYSYGYKGKGNMLDTEEDAQNRFTFEAIHKVEHNEEKISSTTIRNLLAYEKIKEASTLLCRSFSFEGQVVDGDKRGRLLGYPTANI